MARRLASHRSRNQPRRDLTRSASARHRSDRRTKAQVEGAFGLFSQVLPPLVMNTTQERRDLARGFLGLVVDVWGRATNHRPRKDREGRSCVDLSADAPRSTTCSAGPPSSAEARMGHQRSCSTTSAHEAALFSQLRVSERADSPLFFFLILARHDLALGVEAQHDDRGFAGRQCRFGLPARGVAVPSPLGDVASQ
jgi:hypothetical protein